MLPIEGQDRAARAASTLQPLCPVCHRNNHVRRVAALYEMSTYHHDSRFAPPLPPKRRSFLLGPLTVGTVIEVVTLIGVMLLCSSGSFGLEAYALAVIGICLPLLLSVYGFWQLLRTERSAPDRLAWDQALSDWDRSWYCLADKVVFTPGSEKPPALITRGQPSSWLLQTASV
jgi:hypothetical protein